MDAVSLVCCLLAFLLYYTTLDAGFVYDDRRAILTNPDILPTSSWSNLLKNDFWGTPLTDSGSHGSYRPLCVFTFRINYILGGFQPWGYHLVNVLLHVLATGLVVRVARTILPSGCGHFGPAVAGLLFASHPIHTEAVAGIVGRADLAACNLYLLAFLVYVVHVKYRDTVCPKANFYCVCCDSKNIRYADKKTQKTSTVPSSMECSDKMSSRCRSFFANLRKNCYITHNDFCCMKHNMILSALSVVGDTNGSASTPLTVSNRVRGIGSSVDMSSRVIACSCAMVSNTSSGIVSSNIACWTRVFKQWLALVSCLVLATAAVLSKETGISVLVLCGIYDVIHSPLKISNKKQVRSICFLFIALLALLTLRLQMASGNTPTFSTADNPTAREPSIITRFLTFTYLPTFNFRLLLCPVTLSFDWSMEAIPRITSIFDSRNLVSLVFYYILFKTIKYSVNKLRRARNHLKKDTNVYTRRAQNSRLCRRRLQQYGFSDGMTLTSTTTTTTATTTTTLTSLILEQRAHIVGHGMIPTSSSTPCPCPVCHHSVSEHHSPKCRTTNNNNSLPISHSACVCRPASILNTSTYAGTNSIPSQSTYSYSTKDKTKSGAPAAILLAIAFLTLPFLPATNLFFYVGFVVAERVLYLPSVGYCLLFALGAARVWCAYRRHHRVIAACLVLVLVAFSVRTVRRNRDWKDEESLYRSAIHVNPAKAYGNLGSILSSQGRISEAEWAYNRALEHRSNMADVHYNLGLLLQGREQYDEAIRSYQRAIHFRPSLALAYVNLGGALVAAGRCQEAVSILRQGAQLDGAGLKDRRAHDAARVSALLQLGALYADQGRLQRALAAYREALHTMPHHYPPQSVYNLLGETLTRLQQFEEAERWYQAALQAQPDHVPAHITYGKLLAKNSSRVAEAEQWFRRAQRLAPADPSVHHHFGEFLASQQRHAEAALHYVRAAELKPDDYELVVAAATALRQADRRHDAEQWYRQAVQLRPTDARGHTNLGAILHLNGKYSQAAASYREALRLQPDDITTLTNLHKLYSLMA